MSVFEGIFAAAALGFVGFNATLAVLPVAQRRGAWRVPLVACVLFALGSAATIALEGPLGFYPAHSQSAWANQIWLDLLLASTVAFTTVSARLRRVGGTPLAWLPLVALTGSVGLLLMFSRVLFLEERHGTAAHAAEGGS